MSGFIWLIILIVIIVKVKGSVGTSAKKYSAPAQQRWSQPQLRTNPQASQQRWSQPQPGTNPQASQQRWSQPQPGTNLQASQQMERPVSQEALKRRLQQKYGSRMSQQETQTQQRADVRAAVQSEQETLQTERQKTMDILHRAAENVAEFEGEDVLENSDFMKQVNDLMIMGYSQKLSYERDFVAEGVEMLNRFELPQGTLDLSGVPQGDEVSRPADVS